MFSASAKCEHVLAFLWKGTDLISIQCLCYSSSVNVHHRIQQETETAGWKPPRVSSSCMLCRGSYLLPAAPYSRWSDFSFSLFSRLAINQPLMLDASQLFEHDGDPVYIALLQKSEPEEKDLQRSVCTHPLHFCPLSFNISLGLIFYLSSG